jgi:hypothetical protein
MRCLENDYRSEKSVDEQSIDATKLALSPDTQASPPLSHNGEATEDGEQNVITFSHDDKTNPYNWSKTKKVYVVIVGMMMVLNSTMGSALPSGTTAAVQRYWNLENESLLVLPVSIYLIGYILGPLIFAPLSEYVIMLRVKLILKQTLLTIADPTDAKSS